MGQEEGQHKVVPFADESREVVVDDVDEVQGKPAPHEHNHHRNQHTVDASLLAGRGA